MNISELSQEIHANARSKGFWDNERNVGEILMLIVSELSEAMEADRKGIYATELPHSDKIKALSLDPGAFKVWYKAVVKGSFEEEIADAIIRLLDTGPGLGLDLEWHIQAKMKYNATREFMHGKAY